MRAVKYNDSSLSEDTGLMNINLLGKQMAIYYPDSLFMRNMLLHIFKGKDYPIFSLPDYFPKVIFDIGANIGATTLYFNSYFPNSQIYCYEPSQKNYRYLKENTKNFENIKSYPYGLYDESCKLPLYFGKGQSAQDSIVKSNETSEDNEIITLVRVSEELIRQCITKISILKIDTEGCEVPILQDLFKKEDLEVDITYIEYHSEDDRLKIDKIVSNRMMLYHARTDCLHRGSLVYFSKKLISLFPGLERLKKVY